MGKVKLSLFGLAFFVFGFLITPVRDLLKTQSSSSASTLTDRHLQEQLEKLPDVVTVTPQHSAYYSQKYELFIEQPLSYEDAQSPTFQHRFFVYHVGYDRPTVLITEGYNAERYEGSNAPSPLASLLGANVVVVEHRFFSKSTPEEKDFNWDHLTVENATRDLHEIVTRMKTIYPGKWLSTGISKGGQTTLFYSVLYPNEMDAYAPYVGPLCSSVADKRPAEYLAQMGTQEERDAIETFQKELLKRRNRMIPLLEKATQGNQYPVSYDELFDNMVLEYSFALRQYNETLQSIPPLDSDDQTLFDHFLQKVGLSFYETDGWNGTFFVQAARQLGFYTYDMEPFKDLMSIKQCDDYVQRVHLPKGVNYEFDSTIYKKTVDYLRREDPKIIFIYGEKDPWTGAAPQIPEGKKNTKLFIIPDKVHGASITDLPQQQRIEVVEQLKEWLSMPE